MQLKQFLMISLITLSLSGCASKEVLVDNNVIQLAQAPSPVTLHEVTFEVSETSPPKVSMSIKDYENLSLNLAELHRYIKAQRAVIDYYETSISE